MTWPLLASAIEIETDVVSVRQRARRIAELLGFEQQDQTRIATAASEIARNAFAYAGGGRAEFSVEGRERPQTLLVKVIDTGRGVADLPAVLEGRYKSATGMGLGLVGTRRLMDRFEITSDPAQGTTVLFGKTLPRSAPLVAATDVARMAGVLAQERTAEPMGVMRDQNRELMRSLDDLRERGEELRRLNQELEDTNRGVVALYGELDQKAEQLRAASEQKSRFLSNMSHEFRTPLNSILAISRMLLDRIDGDLAPEQERQVGYIRRSAEGLSELVNDLLDLAKVEAGKLDVRPSETTVQELFGALRGALKPLQTRPAVELVFDDTPTLTLWTDVGKLNQVLRNLISNALKFTEAGEVRICAQAGEPGRVVFRVRDTGLGIAAAHLDAIFEEFAQVDSPLQELAKGTGLGLPLSRRLTELLGGEISVRSTPGEGSTFEVVLPVSYRAPAGGAASSSRADRVLVIDDDEAFRYLMRQLVSPARGYIVEEASGGDEGLRLALERPPSLIFLDLQMPGTDGFAVLEALARHDGTRDVPVVISTSVTVDANVRARLGRAFRVLGKDALSRELVDAVLNEVECRTAA